MERYISRLNFSISIPKEWEVYSDKYEEYKPAKQNLSLDEEYKENVEHWKTQVISFDKFEAIYNQDKKGAYRAFFSIVPSLPPLRNEEELEEYTRRELSAKEAYKQLIDDPESYYVSFEEFKRVFGSELKRPSIEKIKKEYENALKSYKAKALSLDKFSELYERDKKKAYIAFFETCIGMPPDEDIEQYTSRNLTAKEAYKQLIDDPETFMVGFEEFKRVCESEYEGKERKLEREKLRDEMIEDIGWFEASPPENEDFVSVEVSKIKLKKHPMYALELYELDKPDSSDIPWGNRPSKPLIVDGLEAIKYYFAYENDKDWVKFLNIYMTDGLTGYIITCSSFWKSFPKYKKLFYSIVQSFKRIQ